MIAGNISFLVEITNAMHDASRLELKLEDFTYIPERFLSFRSGFKAHTLNKYDNHGTKTLTRH